MAFWYQCLLIYFRSCAIGGCDRTGAASYSREFGFGMHVLASLMRSWSTTEGLLRSSEGPMVRSQYTFFKLWPGIQNAACLLEFWYLARVLQLALPPRVIWPGALVVLMLINGFWPFGFLGLGKPSYASCNLVRESMWLSCSVLCGFGTQQRLFLKSDFLDFCSRYQSWLDERKKRSFLPHAHKSIHYDGGRVPLDHSTFLLPFLFLVWGSSDSSYEWQSRLKVKKENLRNHESKISLYFRQIIPGRFKGGIKPHLDSCEALNKREMRWDDFTVAHASKKKSRTGAFGISCGLPYFGRMFLLFSF